MRAIVLSGGGAKGAYEAGVWKALRKLNIKYDIVTGTSIGALNGLLMIQNKYHTCIKMWKNISFDTLFDGFDKDDIVLNYLNKLKDGGIDTSKIKNIIDKNFNVNKVYKSKIKYGIVTYNLTNKKVLYATKENSPNELKNYILASATCFPIFKALNINNNYFIDGGVYDVLPINLALSLGADEIIAVDLKAVGIKRRIKKNIPIKYITPNNKLDSFLNFDSTACKRMIKLGYNDAMKAFNALDGKKYTFKKNTINNMNNNLLSLIKKYDLKEISMLKIIENAFDIFKLNEEEIYSDVEKILINELNKVEDVKINEIDIEKIKKIFSKPVITKFIYNKLKTDEINYKVFKFFPKEFMTALYLFTIEVK